MAVAALSTLAVAACGGNTNVARAEQCREQIILSLAPGVDRTNRVLKDLSRDADVRLEYLRATSPTVFVYTLAARSRDPGCTEALSRLRQDSRVRFAELDRRRSHFDSAR